MKQMRTYMILMAALVLAAACSPDLGNYDYVDLDEPRISDLRDTSVLTFDRLVLSPSVSAGADAEGYSFEWKAIDRNGLVEPVVLGTSMELDYEVILPPGS